MPRPSAAPPDFLGANRVPKTVEAFLTTDVAVLEEGGLLPEEAQTLHALREEVARRYAPPVLTAAQLYEQLQRITLVTTSCQEIDVQLLRGGMRPGQLIEVCGESASGKTQLCLAAAARAARGCRRVEWIDTSNALRGFRLQGVVAAQATAGVHMEGPLAADPLKFVNVRRCYDVHALLAALDDLAAEHAQQQQQQQQQQQAAAAAGPSGDSRRHLHEFPVKLLVVDSLSALISPVLGGGQHSQGHALLAAAAATLKAFADATQAVVLVTNHLVGGSDERRHEKRPAMGESWRNQPHTRLQLSRPPPDGSHGAGGAGDGGEVCLATLRASVVVPPGACVPYVITPAGLLAPAAAAGGQADVGGVNMDY